MQHNKFYSLGKAVYTLRWFLIVLWIISVAICIPFLPNIISPFKTTGFINEHSKSVDATQELNKKLGYTNNRFIILYTSKTLVATDPAFIKAIKRSLSDLKKLPFKYQVFLPDDNKQQISKDKHTAYAVVMLKHAESINDEQLEQFKTAIKTPSGMTVQIGGEPIFVEAVNKQTQTDLYKADFVATPVAIITLILVFGSLVAALLPIFLGGGAALLILTTLYFVGHICTLSIFTLNIALLLGLCLSLDYALFIISRFRDELLHEHKSIQEVIAFTEASAGKAIFYSGLAVFASLSALFLFPINILFSVAVGGMLAVFFAVLTALLFLPAILSILGPNINRLPVRLFKKKTRPTFNTWHWLAEKVVRRPWPYFFSILIVLLMLGYPFLSAKFGVSDFHIFPEHSESRRFFDTYAEKFNENELTPINIVIKTQHDVLSRQSIASLYHLTHRITDNPLVLEVNSIVTLKPDLTKQQYQALYQTPSRLRPAEMKAMLATTTTKHLTVIGVISKYPPESAKTKTLIDELNHLKLPKGMQLALTGSPVDNTDVFETISQLLPHAILWIMIFTYLILLFLLRSLFLPIKAIIMNLLSLSACYGALVFVFQEGHFHQLLNFDPQGMLDISLLVIIFCALFGFSMDYEVFLLTRIKEAHEHTQDTKKSIVFGIEKSSRIITSAALIVIFICGSFLVADVLMVKAFGFGIAVAIFVDAFLIRTLLVPATMTIMKQWNWYLPRWLSKIMPSC